MRCVLSLWCRSETHLQDTHTKGVAKYPVRLMVVAVSDVRAGHKHNEGILLGGVQQAALDHLLELLLALQFVAAQQHSR